MTIDKIDGALVVEWTALYGQDNSLQERKGSVWLPENNLKLR